MGKSIFGLIALLVAGALLFVYTKPAYSAAGDMQAQITQYQDALDKAAQLDALRQKLLAQYNAFSPDDVNRLQTLLPDHVDNIGLILDLDNLASRYGMALENVDVSTPSAASGGSAVGTVGANGLKYDSLSIHFATYGTYNNFRSFIADLERSLRLVDLTSLTISEQGSQPTGGVPAYRYDMTIKTYWLK